METNDALKQMRSVIQEESDTLGTPAKGSEKDVHEFDRKLHDLVTNIEGKIQNLSEEAKTAILEKIKATYLPELKRIDTRGDTLNTAIENAGFFTRIWDFLSSNTEFDRGRRKFETQLEELTSDVMQTINTERIEDERASEGLEDSPKNEARAKNIVQYLENIVDNPNFELSTAQRNTLRETLQTTTHTLILNQLRSIERKGNSNKVRERKALRLACVFFGKEIEKQLTEASEGVWIFSGSVDSEELRKIQAFIKRGFMGPYTENTESNAPSSSSLPKGNSPSPLQDNLGYPTLPISPADYRTVMERVVKYNKQKKSRILRRRAGSLTVSQNGIMYMGTSFLDENDIRNIFSGISLPKEVEKRYEGNNGPINFSNILIDILKYSVSSPLVTAYDLVDQKAVKHFSSITQKRLRKEGNEEVLSMQSLRIQDGHIVADSTHKKDTIIVYDYEIKKSGLSAIKILEYARLVLSKGSS
jgi:hypothetical protein